MNDHNDEARTLIAASIFATRHPGFAAQGRTVDDWCYQWADDILAHLKENGWSVVPNDLLRTLVGSIQYGSDPFHEGRRGWLLCSYVVAIRPTTHESDPNAHVV